MTGIKRPTFPLAGGCLCGAARYEVSEMPFLAYACHCTNCQRVTGSAFALNMPVARHAFRITQGAPKAFRRPSPSGAGSASWFCGDCGGRIYGERDNAPEVYIVRAGTLDDTSWLTPVAHFFLRSAQPWERFAETEAACFEAGSSDYAPLVEAWQRLWRES